MADVPSDSLALYRAKRNFTITTEPADGGEAGHNGLVFVIQKHWASRLHYDLRLELEGAMKSWAVPKGPSFDPADKRMAVQVEDHPIAYNQFEGEIPAGQYGAGKVIIWDEGVWLPLDDPHTGYRAGKLKFEMQGRKMRGRWTLVRMRTRDEKQPPWLLIKEKDEFVRLAAEFSVVDEMPDSVVPLRSKARPRPIRAHQEAATKAPAAVHGKKATPSATSLPATLKPQLATLVDGVPGDAADWLFEIKFDGYRMLARVDNGVVQLFTRNGNDWTHRLPHLVKAVGKMKLASGWLDGEIVVLDDKGVPSFQALQNAFESAHTGGIVFHLFDVPFLNGRDLRPETLETRRAALHGLFDARTPAALRFSEVFDVPPRALVESACKLGLEGVIGKRKSSPYVSRRSDTWIKLKCSRRQEFLIAGYTDPQGVRTDFGSLLLAVHDDAGQLRYAGNVGSGFDQRSLVDLKAKLDALGMPDSPFQARTGLDRTAHWVRPVLLVEVSFSEWTDSGRVRHAVFHGLRNDKPPQAITREKVVHAESIEPTPSTEPTKPRLRVTHPERVIDASTGLTKLDLVRFYGLVAPLLLAHLKARPTSMVRAPDGVGGELFFQKHLEAKMPGVRLLDPALDPDHPPLMEVPTAQAVLSAAQMNVIEFHTWNALKSSIGKPDRMTFDLDPGEGVDWKTVRQGTELVHGFLSELGLVSFLKTSGGKGLHVVVPLKKQYDWDTVKAFSQAIVQHLARTVPQLFVAKSGPKNRVGKIFVDYLRNGFGATTVAAWSARARPGLGVSVPLGWDELGTLSGSAQWTIANIHDRLDRGNAPWADYQPQGLAKAMKALDFKPA